MGRVFVPGKPAPQGSKTRNRHGAIYESNKTVGPWRERVALSASSVMDGREPTRAPVQLNARFMFLRPKGHLRKDGTALPSAPRMPAVKPDLDKLLRAVLDSLSGIVFADDSQVVVVTARKEYANVEGVELVWGAVA